MLLSRNTLPLSPPLELFLETLRLGYSASYMYMYLTLILGLLKLRPQLFRRLNFETSNFCTNRRQGAISHRKKHRQTSVTRPLLNAGCHLKERQEGKIR